MTLEDELEFGSTGDNVKILQEKLKLLGYFNPVITGSFGNATEIGVRMFQKEYGLDETGIVNNDTWNLLFEITEPVTFSTQNYPTLSYGDSGEYVRELQRKLKALLYYNENINGVFDIEVENAVKRFQYNNGLTANGVVNSNTWNFIDILYGNLNSCVIGDFEDDGSQGGENIYYTVVAGDTLYSIARKYNTTVDEIKRLNNLSSNTLNIGQRLIVGKSDESDDVDDFYYVVVAGDTLYSIARKYNTTVDEIKRLNNFSSNTLNIGQRLIIKGSNVSGGQGTINYTVTSGDTLYSIARRYNTTVDEIKRINDLSSNILSVGQVLRIPTSSNYTYYTVSSGDTLYSIARKYDTTVDEIKSVNNLSSNVLSIGQSLRIPLS